jgi:hypothetical protein
MGIQMQATATMHTNSPCSILIVLSAVAVRLPTRMSAVALRLALRAAASRRALHQQLVSLP